MDVRSEERGGFELLALTPNGFERLVEQSMLIRQSGTGLSLHDYARRYRSDAAKYPKGDRSHAHMTAWADAAERIAARLEPKGAPCMP